MYPDISKKTKIILMILLILLNLFIRIPSIPHEKGSDSFFIHSLANSITYFGTANWFVNWLSIFGLYPYSYASAIPFSLSGLAQLTGLTGLDMEKTILLFSIFIGLLSIFTAYVLAGMIYDDFIFKYLMAFFFSISQGVMIFSTWEISARGPFIILLPLFIFVLLKKMHFVKTVCLLLFLFIFLAATHHYYFFLIPLTLLVIAIKILFKIGSKNVFSFSKPEYINYIYCIILVSVSILPFFTGLFIKEGSRYTWVIDMLISNIRYVGPLFIFTFVGLIVLIIKNNKTFVEWYFLSALIVFIPFMYNLTYGAYILVIFIVIYISIAIRNIIHEYKNKNNNYKLIIIFIILSFVLFSSYYNHFRTGVSQDSWKMPDITYKASIWTNSYIPDDMNGFGNEGEAWRLFATSDAHPVIPTNGAAVIGYKLINESYIKTNKIEFSSLDYYFEGPYTEQPNHSIWGLISGLIESDNINSMRTIKLLETFSMKYFIEDKFFYQSNSIIPSIHITKNNIYNNGRIGVWLI